MKLRIKYTKTGSLRFIGHLDIMRFFQKAIRRAKLDVAYSKGFSPHQMISFAAPMPLGMTSEGEYFDGEFERVTTVEDMKNRLNAVMPPEIQVLDIVKLPEDAKPSMAIVSASDYYIYPSAAGGQAMMQVLLRILPEFSEQETIEVLKKSKSKEVLTDIKPLIYEMHAREEGIYMLLASGSRDNLKPELVLEALCKKADVSYSAFDYRVHRLETYMGDAEHLLPLSASGTDF